MQTHTCADTFTQTDRTDLQSQGQAAVGEGSCSTEFQVDLISPSFLFLQCDVSPLPFFV